MAHRIETIIQLKPDEEVLDVVQENLVPHLPKFFLIALWFVAPFFFLFPLFREGLIGVIAFFAIAGSAAAVGWRALVRWSGTVLVVTDRRIVDVDQLGLFSRQVSEIPNARVEDVSYRVTGLFPTLFRYGDIHVQSAGDAADIEFHRVSRPSRVCGLIGDVRG